MAITVTTTAASEITTNSATTGGEITTTEDITYIPLVDVLMKAKFQFAQTSRQTLIGELHNDAVLKPLQMVVDDKQSNKPFLLTSFRMNLCEDSYDGIELLEYNNSSEVVLVET